MRDSKRDDRAAAVSVRIAAKPSKASSKHRSTSPKLPAPPSAAQPERRPKASKTRPKPDEMATRILAAIVHSSDAAIIASTLDGIVTSWNPAAEKMFGYSASEMIGGPLAVIAPPNRPKEIAQIHDAVMKTSPNFHNVSQPIALQPTLVVE